MKKSQFEWRTGIVEFWDLDELDMDVPPCDQAGHLKEDLVQVEFPNGRILDVGWFPSFQAEGAFSISVIKGGDWENPIGKWNSRTWLEFSETLSEAVRVASGE